MKNHRTRRTIPPSFAILATLLSAGCLGQPHATAQSSSLPHRLDAVFDRLASTGAVIHARVIELPSRRELYARRSDEPCTPASNLKLLTSATGLDLFGPTHTFKTYLAQDGDDLWLIGTGDPGTGDPRLAKAAGQTPLSMLEAWAAALEHRGIHRIAGDLVYYDGAFDEQRVHPAWSKSFLTHWYAAPVSGLNFNDSSIDFTVSPGEPDQPAKYEMMPPVDSVTIVNHCLTKPTGAPTGLKVAGENTYQLGGACSKRTELLSLPVDDPGAFFAEALRVQLSKHGITIAGRIRRSPNPLDGTMPPPPAKVIAVHETKLTDVISRINKNSQNLFAECLCKLNGQAYATRQGRQVAGSWADGGGAVHAFLKKSGIDDSRLTLIDGSGLSDRNRVTTRILTDLLAVMFSRPDGGAYRASLSVAGVDGSLRSRMPGLKEHVFGKTGYIGGVSSTSGYLHTRNGRWLAFSFIYNHLPETHDDDSDTESFTQLQDEACAILYSGEP